MNVYDTLIFSIIFVLGFFTAVGVAMIWVHPWWESEPATVPPWVHILARWGTWQPPSPFHRSPAPPTEMERGIVVHNVPYLTAETQQLPHIRPAMPVPPEEPDEWGDPDGTWVDQLHEYRPRHGADDR